MRWRGTGYKSLTHLFPVIPATAVTDLDCAFIAERTSESHLPSQSLQEMVAPGMYNFRADMKLNLGCGDHVIEGWTNVDYALDARLNRLPLFRVVNRKLRIFSTDWDKRIVLHDLTKRFPWPDSSVDVVYSAHALEHFTKEHGRAFLAECYRVLRPRGIIRIVVPDLR